MARLPKVTVCGTGAIARATAADLSLSGAEVTLFELPTQADNLVPFLEKGGIDRTSQCKCSTYGFCYPHTRSACLRRLCSSSESLEGR